MKIISKKESDKPKNYSRKGRICTCQCNIIDNKEQIIEKVMVKYEITYNQMITSISNSNFKTNKYKWSTWQNFGFFKDVIEIPSIFSKMEENDFIIHTSNFCRDKVLVPYICDIEVLNIENYKLLKTQENRKKKLNNIIYTS